MYNRYIPQSDGSFRRSPVRDQQQSTPPRQQRPPQNRQQRQQPAPPCPPPEKPCDPPPQPHCAMPCGGHPTTDTFLRRLLPKDFDTGDLLVMLLLLLMAGDNPDERGSALLTLALYFIL